MADQAQHWPARGPSQWQRTVKHADRTIAARLTRYASGVYTITVTQTGRSRPERESLTVGDITSFADGVAVGDSLLEEYAVTPLPARTITVIPHRPSRQQLFIVLMAIITLTIALTKRILLFCAGLRIWPHRPSYVRRLLRLDRAKSRF